MQGFSSVPLSEITDLLRFCVHCIHSSLQASYKFTLTSGPIYLDQVGLSRPERGGQTLVPLFRMISLPSHSPSCLPQYEYCTALLLHRCPFSLERPPTVAFITKVNMSSRCDWSEMWGSVGINGLSMLYKREQRMVSRWRNYIFCIPIYRSPATLQSGFNLNVDFT